MADKKNTKNKSSDIRPLTAKEKAFCKYYIESNNGQQSAIKAGYAPRSANAAASRLLTHVNIHQEIERLREKQENKSIATSQEVMQFFTDVMNGKVKDQFGLDASLSDRTRAAQELAKRTIDLDNRLKGINTADTTVTIKLDWN